MSLAAISGEHDRPSQARTVALASVTPVVQRSLLIVDADDILRERLGAVFRACGFDVQLASSCEQGRAAAHARIPDMLLLDPRLPGRSGLISIDELRALHTELEIVLWSAYARIGSTSDGHRFSALPYLRKPADADDILSAFGRARTTQR